MYNRITLIGRLVKDVELKTLNNNTTIGNFTLAVNRDYDKDTADFINCTVWNKTAGNMSRFTSKGSLVMVEGSLNIDKSGDNWFTKVNCSKVVFLNSKDNTQETETKQTPPQKKEAELNEFYEETKVTVSDDDLPY